MQRIRAREETPSSGSQTVTATPEQPTAGDEHPAILHLQAISNPDERRVTWDEEVIDNENMGKKSSKVCCIYHRPRKLGESSSEESSSASSSSDDDSDDGSPSHRHDLRNGDEPCHKHTKSKGAEKRKRRHSPNFYERQPQYDKKRGGKSKPDENRT